jgi:Terminase RNaseH-like domain
MRAVKPAEWARKAISLYRKWSADHIIGGINQGGQLIETTLRAVDADIPFRGVRAKRGKIIRAEPVSALYEQGKVKHVGIFNELEDQLTTYAGGGDSPDRLDALVYALSDLMLGYQVQPVPIVAPVIITGPGLPEIMRAGPMPDFTNRVRSFLDMATKDVAKDVTAERFDRLMQKTGLLSCPGPLTDVELHRQYHDRGLTDDDKVFLRAELIQRGMLMGE